MIRVLVMDDRDRVCKDLSFDERKDDDAVRKAFIECDRSVWSYEPGQVIGLWQNNRLLRSFTSEEQGWVFLNNNGIYNLGD